MGASSGLYGAIGVLGLILRIAKEIFTVVLLFQGIRLVTIYIKKNKSDNISPKDENNTAMDTETEVEEEVKGEDNLDE
jgi:hypothetical protein